MPIIMAKAVMQTGRKRVSPGLECGPHRIMMAPRIRSFAKETTRILLAVATPMHMMAPISAGTLKACESK